VLDFAKEQLHLSSPLSGWVVIVIGAVWVWRRPASRWPRVYLAAVALAYWFVSTPIGAALIAQPLSATARVQSRAEARDADTVVLLGGGVVTAQIGGYVGGALLPGTLLRTLEAARVFNLIGAKTIIASGGIPRSDRQLRPESEFLRDALIKAGLAPQMIVEEPQSKTTREQALEVAKLLRQRHADRFVLVTSADHMSRSLAVFRRTGLDPIPSAAPLRSDGESRPTWFLPNSDSLWLSDLAFYEYAATVYYRIRGWI
jgi:uncharacterized SAM-binding protein YcdF (DUF218 family)